MGQFVYVLRRGNKYKLGFTRNLPRRLRVLKHDEVIITVEVPRNYSASQLEYLLNNRFSSKRLPPQGTASGDRREWFAFDDADLVWLRGLTALFTA